MTDLLKPIVVSLQIDHVGQISDALLRKLVDFASGADARATVPKGRREYDPAEYNPKLLTVSFSEDATEHTGWFNDVAAFVDDLQLPVGITSNFAREFGDEDLLGLSKLRQIAINVDSSSPATLERLRSVDLRTLIANVVRLRQAMLESNRKATLHFNCTVSKDTITHLGGLARLASILQVDALNIGDETDARVNAEVSHALNDLSDVEAQQLALSLIDAANALKGTSTEISLRPSLKSKLEPVVVAMSERRPVDAASFRSSAQWTKGSPCLQPWETVIVQEAGDVKLCRGPIEPSGNVYKDLLINIANGPVARKLRSKLLEGGKGLPCELCVFSNSDTPETFRGKVRAAQERYDSAIHPWQAAVPTGLDYDTQYGVNTQAKVFLDDLDPEEVGAALEHATHYIPTAVENIDIILDAVAVRPERFTLIDLGCGMGRVLLHAAKRPFRQIVGVEVSPALLEVARKNVDSYKGPIACRDIVLVRADAAEFVFPSGDIIVYMNNPFTDAILRPVIERLTQHVGHVVIAYAGPIHGSVIDGNPRFVAVSRFALSDARQACRVWESRESGVRL